MSKIFQAFGSKGFGTYSAEWERGKLRFTPSTGKAKSTLIPGFVDIHLHGAFGIDFMSATTDQMVTLLDKLNVVGYDRVLLTSVTAPMNDVLVAMNNVPKHPVFGGFHIEGPFISPQYPGAQPQKHILTAEGAWESWAPVWANKQVKIVTMAPEIPGAIPLARRLKERGVKVSMGHTNASFKECLGTIGCFEHVTHTYNAMRGLHHREVGALGFALSCPLTCELLFDGHHVSTEAAQILLIAQRVTNVVGISDSTMASGLPNGSRITMWGQKCVVSDGTVKIEGTDTLAGSAVTLDTVFRNLWEQFGPAAAIKLCCINPARAIKVKHRTWLELDDNLNIIDRYDASGQAF